MNLDCHFDSRLNYYEKPSTYRQFASVVTMIRAKVCEISYKHTKHRPDLTTLQILMRTRHPKTGYFPGNLPYVK